MSTHPTPWRVDDHIGWIVDAHGNEVCQADTTATARQIVAAVNEAVPAVGRYAEAMDAVMDAVEDARAWSRQHLSGFGQDKR